MIINSEVSACQLIRRFLATRAPLLWSVRAPALGGQMHAPIVWLSRCMRLLQLRDQRVNILQGADSYRHRIPVFHTPAGFLEAMRTWPCERCWRGILRTKQELQNDADIKRQVV